MNKDHTKRILNFINSNYEIFINKSDDDMMNITFAWHQTLKDYRFEDVALASQEYLKRSRIKPKPNCILDILIESDARKHKVFKELTYDKIESADKLTKELLVSIMNDKYRPFKGMNIFKLPQETIDRLTDPLPNNHFNNFIDKVWGMIMTTDMIALHVEIANITYQSHTLIFESFMKCLLKADDIINNFNYNKDDEIKNAKYYLNNMSRLIA